MGFVLRVIMKQVLYDPFGEITISEYQILKLVTILTKSVAYLK